MPILFLLYLSFLTPNMSWPAQPQMQQAFLSMTQLLPFITSSKDFSAKENDKNIKIHLKRLANSFTNMKHETVLKKDLFAPSYFLLNTELKKIQEYFGQGEKPFALWKLKQITAECIDCHLRIPKDKSPSLELTFNLDEGLFDSNYNRGIGHLILRNYFEAKNNFISDIDTKMLQGQYSELALPLKQLLLVELKVMRDPDRLMTTLTHYKNKKLFPGQLKVAISSWLEHLKRWKEDPISRTGLKNDRELISFIKKHLETKYEKKSPTTGSEIDLLISNGILSSYFFNHPETIHGGLLNFWIGETGQLLDGMDFQSDGIDFFQQCLYKYSNEPIAKSCYDSYEKAVYKKFGQSGTIPIPFKLELDFLKNLIGDKKK
jgi:hypothetical protein